MVLYFKHKKLWLVLGIIILLFSLLQSSLLWQLLYPIKYREAIKKYAQQNDVDPFLVAAVIRTESRFQPEVESKRGARGLMQIMPQTGRWIAEQSKYKEYKDEKLYDPEINIRLGTWYLANLKAQFKEDVIVLAAYNAGRGNVRQWLKSGRWTGEKSSIEDLPFAETRDYVKKVLNYRKTYYEVYEGKF